MDWTAAGDMRAARYWTERAMLACRESGDTAGVITYFENSQVLEACTFLWWTVKPAPSC